MRDTIIRKSVAVEVVAEVTIAANKGNGVVEDTASSRLTRADSTAGDWRLSALGHQTRIEFEVVDVAVQ